MKIDAYINLGKDTPYSYGILGGGWKPDFCYPSKYTEATLQKELKDLASYYTMDYSKHPATITIKKDWPLDKVGTYTFEV